MGKVFVLVSCLISLWICFLLPPSIPSDISLCLIEVCVTGELPSCCHEVHLNISGISYKLHKCNVWNTFHILFVWVNTKWNLISKWNVKMYPDTCCCFFNTSYLSFSSHPNETFSSLLLSSVIEKKKCLLSWNMIDWLSSMSLCI